VGGVFMRRALALALLESSANFIGRFVAHTC
jgi:hypothetical protein